MSSGLISGECVPQSEEKLTARILGERDDDCGTSGGEVGSRSAEMIENLNLTSAERVDFLRRATAKEIDRILNNMTLRSSQALRALLPLFRETGAVSMADIKRIYEASGSAAHLSTARYNFNNSSALNGGDVMFDDVYQGWVARSTRVCIVDSIPEDVKSLHSQVLRLAEKLSGIEKYLLTVLCFRFSGVSLKVLEVLCAGYGSVSEAATGLNRGALASVEARIRIRRDIAVLGFSDLGRQLAVKPELDDRLFARWADVVVNLQDMSSDQLLSKAEEAEAGRIKAEKGRQEAERRCVEAQQGRAKAEAEVARLTKEVGDLQAEIRRLLASKGSAAGKPAGFWDKKPSAKPSQASPDIAQCLNRVASGQYTSISAANMFIAQAVTALRSRWMVPADQRESGEPVSGELSANDLHRFRGAVADAIGNCRESFVKQKLAEYMCLIDSILAYVASGKATREGGTVNVSIAHAKRLSEGLK